MKNLEIARIFFEIAELLEIKGVQSKAIKYRRAAQFIKNSSVSIKEIYRDGNLEDVIEFDQSTTVKIREIVETGKLEYHDQLKSEFPDDLFRLASLLRLGFPRAKVLYEQFGFERLDDLEKAALEQSIRNLEGFGKKQERQILDIVVEEKKKKVSTLLSFVYPVSKGIVKTLMSLKDVKRISIVGSLRRRKETVQGIDIIIVSLNPEYVTNSFTTMDSAKKVLVKGDKKSEEE